MRLAENDDTPSGAAKFHFEWRYLMKMQDGISSFTDFKMQQNSTK